MTAGRQAHTDEAGPSHRPIIVEIMRAGAIFETSDKPMGER